MVKHAESAGGSELVERLGEIVELVGQLAGQQLRLLTSEVRHDLHEAGDAALCVGGSAGMFAAGAFLSTLTVVHLLHRTTRLPLWACYGIAAGLAGGAGLGLARTAQAKLVGQFPPLPQSREALQENFAWLREQLTLTPR